MEKRESTKRKEELKHSINRAELRGTTMCKEHVWTQISDNEFACRICPTAIRVHLDDVNNYK